MEIEAPDLGSCPSGQHLQTDELLISATNSSPISLNEETPYGEPSEIAGYFANACR
jgi:hypothetical protein